MLPRSYSCTNALNRPASGKFLPSSRSQPATYSCDSERDVTIDCASYCIAGRRRRTRGMPSVKSRVEIHYCTQCRWLMRAAWIAQELLTTFEDEIGQLVLVPRTGGIFEVRADGDLLWSRKERGRLPELKELKQLIRDRVAPGKDLGHSDRRNP